MAASWFLQLIVIGWLHGADWRSLIVGAVIVALQSLAGIAVGRRLLGGDVSLDVGSVGLGITGIVAVQALIVVIGGHRLPLLSILIPLCALIVVSVPRRDCRAIPRSCDIEAEWVIVASPVLGLLPWSWPLASAAIPAWGLALAARRRWARIDVPMAAAALTVVAVAARGALRPARSPWLERMVSNDTLQDEAISAGLMQWGPSTNVGLVGSPTRYHFLSHAWVGQLSTDLDLSGFVAHLILQPVVAYTAIGCLAAALARRVGASRRGVAATLVMVFGQASAAETLLPVEFLKSSMTLGTASALATMLLVARDDDMTRWRRAVVGIGCGIVMIGTKLHFGVIVVAALALATTSSVEGRGRAACRAGWVGLGGGVGWLLFFRGTAGTDRVVDVGAAADAASLVVLAGLVVTVLTRIPLGTTKVSNPEAARLLSASTVAVAVYAVLGMTSSGEASGRNYAVTFAFVTAAPLVGRSLEVAWDALVSRRRMLIVAGLGLGTGLGLAYEILKWRIYEDGSRALIRSVVVDHIGSSLIVVLCAMGIVGIDAGLSRRTPSARDGLRMWSLVVVACAVGVFATKVGRQPIGDLVYGDLPVESETAGYTSPDFESTVAWLRSQTPATTIVATTTPCISRTTAGSACRVESCADWRIGALALAARTERRMWLEAPAYMSDTSDQTLRESEIERRYLVLRQARTGDVEAALATMRRDGVDVLVVDLRFPLARSVDDAVVVYRNASYEVIEL